MLDLFIWLCTSNLFSIIINCDIGTTEQINVGTKWFYSIKRWKINILF